MILKPSKLVIVVAISGIFTGCKQGQAESKTSDHAASPQSEIFVPKPIASNSLLELNPTSDKTKWGEISAAFQQELLPDQVAEPGLSPYTRKHVERIWICGETALVVLEKQTDNKDDQEWDRLFELYNYNRKTREKSQLSAKWPFWLWKFRQLTRFENGAVPDIAFQTLSCTECEPEVILSSARFDQRSGKWQLRKWLQGAEGVVVGDTAVDVDGTVEEYMALDGIADFRVKGRDEIAVWTHYRDVDEKDPKKKLPAVTTLYLYGYENGAPVEFQVKDETEIKRIKKLLCEGKTQTDACKIDK